MKQDRLKSTAKCESLTLTVEFRTERKTRGEETDSDYKQNAIKDGWSLLRGSFTQKYDGKGFIFFFLEV